jgi:hypothetical protein
MAELEPIVTESRERTFDQFWKVPAVARVAIRLISYDRHDNCGSVLA